MIPLPIFSGNDCSTDMHPQQRLFTAYVDLSFLEKLLRNKPDPIDDANGEWMDIWRDVFAFLRQHATVIVDGKQEEVFGDKTLTQVLLSDGQPDVEFEPGITSQIDGEDSWLGEDPFSVFLFEDQDASLRELRMETGLLFLRHKDLTDRWSLLFQSSSIDLHGNDSSFRWKDLAQHARPLNSILVVDKYAYSQLASRSKFVENLGSLLSTLLPDHTPGHSIHVAIVTGLKEAYEDKGYRVSDLFETVRSFLDDRFGHLDIRLRLLGFDQDQHEDRFLFTNYGFFYSGDSFDYFQEDGTLQKDTLVKYLPLKGHETEARKRLARFGKINVSPSSMITGGERVRLAEGDLGHRLLDWTLNQTN